MTHGNVMVATGTCRVCGRKEQPITAAGYCVDEFACCEAYVRVPEHRIHYRRWGRP